PGPLPTSADTVHCAACGGRCFAVKPMNCPGPFLPYKALLWSYRALPVRFADFGRLHRYELSGVTAGLTRGRTFSQGDAHIFTPFENVEGGIFRFLDFSDALSGAFGFTPVEGSFGLPPANPNPTAPPSAPR